MSSRTPTQKKSLRVAVVGAGIAGMGAAWSLHRGGHQVSVYEARASLGGNARTRDWQPKDTPAVRTGLSVLAWPAEYFRNYEHLLAQLELATAPVDIRYLVTHRWGYTAHGEDSPGRRRFGRDFERWNAMVRRVRAVNARFSGSDRRSLYQTSPLNPMAWIPLQRFARLSGLSRTFWDHFVVPVYSSSFLTVDLSGVPTVILPTLDDIVGLEHGSQLRTWRGSSSQVFERMAQGFSERVYTDRAVTSIERRADALIVRDAQGDEAAFDRVVLACNARSALRATPRPTRRHRGLLGGIEYTEDIDRSYLEGVAHSDPRVLPEAHRAALLERFCNHVDVIPSSTGRPSYENTFIISSWAPSARGSTLPMLVTYNAQSAIEGPQHAFSNALAHPSLSLGNLSRAAALRLIQGVDGVFYCGSYTTPGNGHDLSLLSGLVVAHALEAPYPFAEDGEALADFKFLQRFMLGRRGAWR